MKFLNRRVVVALAIILAIVMFYTFGLSQFFSLQQLQIYSHRLQTFVDNHYTASVIVYQLLLALVVILGLPVVTLFIIAAGHLFGVLWGLVYSDIAMSVGACVAVYAYRYLFFAQLEQRWSEKLSNFIREVKAHGGSYLLSMQLLSAIPFFVINTVAVIARIPLFTVAWTSAVGSLPFLLIYLIAGSQLFSLTSLKDLMSFKMMLVFAAIALLAMLPILIRKLRSLRSKH